jgi:prephenate dehydrogenase
MKTISESTIAIIGLGLMGGSLAAALKGKCGRVVGLARREATVDFALSHGIVDSGTTNMNMALENADIVVLATPVRTIIKQVSKVGALLKQEAILMDLGSTKKEILEEMKKLPEHVQAIGGHPMCGKELSGIEAFDESLYEEKTFILVPLPQTTKQTIDTACRLAKTLGSVPLIIDTAERHDYLQATLSYLPYLIACALVSTANETTSKDEAAWKIVASGFRDTSRVSASDVTMMTDILFTNREEIITALRGYATRLDRLAQLVKGGNQKDVESFFSQVRNYRQEMFP